MWRGRFPASNRLLASRSSRLSLASFRALTMCAWLLLSRSARCCSLSLVMDLPRCSGRAGHGATPHLITMWLHRQPLLRLGRRAPSSDSHWRTVARTRPAPPRVLDDAGLRRPPTAVGGCRAASVSAHRRPSPDAVLRVDRGDAGLTAWEKRLRLAEEELSEREERALADDPSRGRCSPWLPSATNRDRPRDRRTALRRPRRRSRSGRP